MSELLINRIDFNSDGSISAIDGNGLLINDVLAIVWRWNYRREGFAPVEAAVKPKEDNDAEHNRQVVQKVMDDMRERDEWFRKMINEALGGVNVSSRY